MSIWLVCLTTRISRRKMSRYCCSSKLVVARQEDVPNVVHDDSWDAGLSMPGSR